MLMFWSTPSNQPRSHGWLKLLCGLFIATDVPWLKCLNVSKWNFFVLLAAVVFACRHSSIDLCTWQAPPAERCASICYCSLGLSCNYVFLPDFKTKSRPASHVLNLLHSAQPSKRFEVKAIGSFWRQLILSYCHYVNVFWIRIWFWVSPSPQCSFR